MPCSRCCRRRCFHCCRRRPQTSFSFVDHDANLCCYAFVQGRLERTVGDGSPEIIEELYQKTEPDGTVLVGDTLMNMGFFPKERLAILEMWARNAGVALTSPVDSRTEFQPLRKIANNETPADGGPLRLFLHRAYNVPYMDALSATDAYVTIEVFEVDGEQRKLLAMARSSVLSESYGKFVWDEAMELPSQNGPHSVAESVPPSAWDLKKTELKFTLTDKDTASNDDFIGACTMPLSDVIERRNLELLLWDKYAEAVVGPRPFMPCELSLQVDIKSFPQNWPRPVEENKLYPCHVFMMTRGTRGDVQPFVALARGMAEQLGWLVTICTEVRWKSFIKKHVADVNTQSEGRIRFRPSGGDTEARINKPLAQWAMNAKTELMQMMILASAEAEFFPSSTVYLRQVQAFKSKERDQPVDLMIFGLTVAQIAALISEKLEIPLAGFILQPSCIPSKFDQWKAVQEIRTHYFSWVDDIEKGAFTGHKSLERCKHIAENNWFTALSIRHLREYFGLPPMPHDNIWELFAQRETPLVIPMKEGAFENPSDWYSAVVLTDFIFLRTADNSASSLSETIEAFIKSAREANAKLGLMTFSSMPIARKTMLGCAVKMVEECQYNLRLIYVGTCHRDEGSGIEKKAKGLVDEGRFLEVPNADFGALFNHMDCFIVHGGLGTTIEALRQRKPCTVAGPLLLDQRFWGSICYEKGVGMPVAHIDQFENCCVEFVNGALSPQDAQGWQANANGHDWGDGDGVKANVDCFATLWRESGYSGKPVKSNKLRPLNTLS